MPAWEPTSATAATAAPDDGARTRRKAAGAGGDGAARQRAAVEARRPAPRARAPVPAANLLAMTGLGAADGTILLLAAQGTLSSLVGAIATGLTVIAGVGAWLVARDGFCGRTTPRDRAALLTVALATSLATVAAAWLGDLAGGAVQFHVLPRVAGLVLLLIAVEVGGLRLPRVARLPLPAALLAVGALVEGVAQWTL
jgi:hypothetical protein